MNKTELVAAMADKAGLTKKDAEAALKAFTETVTDELKKGEKIADFEARTQGIEMPLIEKIFDDIAPKYAERIKEKGQRGGYTRVLKLGFRQGDAADMVILELVDYKLDSDGDEKKSAPKAKAEKSTKADAAKTKKPAAKKASTKKADAEAAADKE
mgnify:CR=1 FL=1